MNKILIIPRISPETTVADIKAFVEPSLDPIFKYIKFGKVVRIEIMALKEKGMDYEYHAIVTVTGPTAMKRIINKCNRKRLGKVLVNVREYKVRSYKNDTRNQFSNKVSDLGIDAGQRVGDRRRSLQPEFGVNKNADVVKIMGVEKFARQGF